MFKKNWFIGLVFGILLAGVLAGCDAIGPSDTTTTTRAATTTTAAATTTSTTPVTTTSTSTTSTTSTTLILAKDYYPNADGNIWLYKLLEFSGGITTESTSSIEVTFDGTQEVGGLTAQIRFQYEVLPGGGLNTEEATLIIADNTDVREYGSADSPTTEATQLDLHFPTVAGDTWLWNLAFDSINLTTEALAEESVTVPAGTFSCFRVRFIGGNPGFSHPGKIFWYAKDVGLVKYIEGFYNPSEVALFTRTFELISKNF